MSSHENHLTSKYRKGHGIITNRPWQLAYGGRLYVPAT